MLYSEIAILYFARPVVRVQICQQGWLSGLHSKDEISFRLAGVTHRSRECFSAHVSGDVLPLSQFTHCMSIELLHLWKKLHPIPWLSSLVQESNLEATNELCTDATTSLFASITQRTDSDGNHFPSCHPLPRLFFITNICFRYCHDQLPEGQGGD